MPAIDISKDDLALLIAAVRIAIEEKTQDARMCESCDGAQDLEDGYRRLADRLRRVCGQLLAAQHA